MKTLLALIIGFTSLNLSAGYSLENFQHNLEQVQAEHQRLLRAYNVGLVGPADINISNIEVMRATYCVNAAALYHQNYEFKKQQMNVGLATRDELIQAGNRIKNFAASCYSALP